MSQLVSQPSMLTPYLNLYKASQLPVVDAYLMEHRVGVSYSMLDHLEVSSIFKSANLGE